MDAIWRYCNGEYYTKEALPGRSYRVVCRVHVLGASFANFFVQCGNGDRIEIGG